LEDSTTRPREQDLPRKSSYLDQTESKSSELKAGEDEAYQSKIVDE
jgi:hypothetical protein